MAKKSSMAFKLSKTKLLFDLYIAFENAKKNKSKKTYVKEFESNLHSNLVSLCDELWEKRYIPQPSFCFIVNEPKKREIFAANFRDRIVHHLYFNYVHQLFENIFIADSYSCIKDRGTHYGINRLDKHIREESQNYSKECYVLKMDIRGYFIHINRLIMLDIVNRLLDKCSNHKSPNGEMWKDVIDYDFVKYLSEKLIMLNPTKDCIFKCDKKEWFGLPSSKSLFYSKENCGLPIGNLTSQLLSNVYLNVLDQYMKRELKCKHYGRYVDDFFVVSKDKAKLKTIVPLVKKFLKEKLDLDLHLGKTKIVDIKYGVEFLGGYIKPYRRYISNSSLRRMKSKLSNYRRNEINKHLIASVNSFLGILGHYDSFKLRKLIFSRIKTLLIYGYFSKNFKKIKGHFN